MRRQIDEAGATTAEGCSVLQPQIAAPLGVIGTGEDQLHLLGAVGPRAGGDGEPIGNGLAAGIVGHVAGPSVDAVEQGCQFQDAGANLQELAFQGLSG